MLHPPVCLHWSHRLLALTINTLPWSWTETACCNTSTLPSLKKYLQSANGNTKTVTSGWHFLSMWMYDDPCFLKTYLVFRDQPMFLTIHNTFPFITLDDQESIIMGTRSSWGSYVEMIMHLCKSETLYQITMMRKLQPILGGSRRWRMGLLHCPQDILCKDSEQGICLRERCSSKQQKATWYHWNYPCNIYILFLFQFITFSPLMFFFTIHLLTSCNVVKSVLPLSTNLLNLDKSLKPVY